MSSLKFVPSSRADPENPLNRAYTLDALGASSAKTTTKQHAKSTLSPAPGKGFVKAATSAFDISGVLDFIKTTAMFLIGIAFLGLLLWMFVKVSVLEYRVDNISVSVNGTWLVGEGPPDAALGEPGQWYRDLLTGDDWYKTPAVVNSSVSAEHAAGALGPKNGFRAKSVSLNVRAQESVWVRTGTSLSGDLGGVSTNATVERVALPYVRTNATLLPKDGPVEVRIWWSGTNELTIDNGLDGGAVTVDITGYLTVNGDHVGNVGGPASVQLHELPIFLGPSEIAGSGVFLYPNGTLRSVKAGYFEEVYVNGTPLGPLVANASVAGPASSVDGALVFWIGPDGKTLGSSLIRQDGAGNLFGINQITASSFMNNITGTGLLAGPASTVANGLLYTPGTDPTIAASSSTVLMTGSGGLSAPHFSVGGVDRGDMNSPATSTTNGLLYTPGADPTETASSSTVLMTGSGGLSAPHFSVGGVDRGDMNGPGIAVTARSVPVFGDETGLHVVESDLKVFPNGTVVTTNIIHAADLQIDNTIRTASLIVNDTNINLLLLNATGVRGPAGGVTLHSIPRWEDGSATAIAATNVVVDDLDNMQGVRTITVDEQVSSPVVATSAIITATGDLSLNPTGSNVNFNAKNAINIGSLTATELISASINPTGSTVTFNNKALIGVGSIQTPTVSTASGDLSLNPTGTNINVNSKTLTNLAGAAYADLLTIASDGTEAFQAVKFTGSPTSNIYIQPAKGMLGAHMAVSWNGYLDTSGADVRDNTEARSVGLTFVANEVLHQYRLHSYDGTTRYDHMVLDFATTNAVEFPYGVIAPSITTSTITGGGGNLVINPATSVDFSGKQLTNTASVQTSTITTPAGNLVISPAGSYVDFDNKNLIDIISVTANQFLSGGTMTINPFAKLITFTNSDLVNVKSIAITESVQTPTIITLSGDLSLNPTGSNVNFNNKALTNVSTITSTSLQTSTITTGSGDLTLNPTGGIAMSNKALTGVRSIAVSATSNEAGIIASYGSPTDKGTVTPTAIDRGGGYSTEPGKNPKDYYYRTASNPYGYVGIGVSIGSMDLMNNLTSPRFTFYTGNAIERFRISSTVVASTVPMTAPQFGTSGSFAADTTSGIITVTWHLVGEEVTLDLDGEVACTGGCLTFTFADLIPAALRPAGTGSEPERTGIVFAKITTGGGRRFYTTSVSTTGTFILETDASVETFRSINFQHISFVYHI